MTDDRLRDELRGRSPVDERPEEIASALASVKRRGERQRKVRLVAGSLAAAAALGLGLVAGPATVRFFDRDDTLIAGRPSPARQRLQLEGWTVTVPRDWSLAVDSPALAVIERAADPAGRISLLKPSSVYDPETGEPEEVPDPPQAIINAHPDLRLDDFEASPVTIAGFAGSYYDARVARRPSTRPDLCAAPCLPLFQISRTETFTVEAGARARFIVVNADGEFVVIVAQAGAAAFDRFISAAEELLASVEATP